MEAGVNSNNNHPYINVCKLVENIGDIASSLPAIHCFSGCDYTAAFWRKGKVKFYKQAETSQEEQSLYRTLGQGPNISEDMIVSSEKIVCKAYGKPQMTSVNDARYAIFRQKYVPTNATEPLAKIKQQTQGSSLLAEMSYVAYMWKHAYQNNPLHGLGLDPYNSGWKMKDGRYDIEWCEGEQMSRDIEKNIDYQKMIMKTWSP